MLRRVRNAPQQKRVLEPDDDAPKLHKVLADAGMVALKGMTELEALEIRGTPVRGPGLANLKGMTKLRLLTFGELNTATPSPLSDAGLAEMEDKACPGAGACGGQFGG